ncbi:MAG: CBS domain-containing protein [Rhodocyclaceae bacterium]|nr:CBS domain-containing protein [Rhodocyclaceae bacterium]
MSSIFELKLGALASRTVLTVTPDLPFEDAARRLAQHGISSLVVCTADKPVGIVTERDLVRYMSAGAPGGEPVARFMSAPLVTAHPDLDFAAAQILMANHGIRHLVLIGADGGLYGVVSESDFQRRAGSDVYAAIHSLDLVMDQDATVVEPDCPLAQALDTMAAGHLDHLLVGHHGIPAAIFTERDVPPLLARGADRHALRMGEVSNGPLVTIAVDAPVELAVRRMQAEGLRHLAVVDRHGRVVGVVSQHRLLERLGALVMEDCRNRLESRLAMVLRAAGIVAWEFDHSRASVEQVAAFNGGTQSHAGSRCEALADLLQRVDPRDRARLESCLLDQPPGAGALFAVEYRSAGDATRWTSARGRVVERDAAGRPLLSAGVLVDLSAQKASETRLHASERRYRGLIEGAPVAMAGIGRDSKVQFVNQPFSRLFGYTAADLPTMDAWWEQSRTDPETGSRARAEWASQRMAAYTRGAAMGPIEYCVRCRDGSTRDVEIFAIASGEEILATFIDVTERRREKALLEFNNAILHRISAGAALGEVLWFIAHEIDALEAGVRCSILLLDESGLRFCNGIGPSLPDDFLRALEGVNIGPEVGTCGVAAHTGRAVFTADIANDPFWPAQWRSMAARHELGACWSAPLVAKDSAVLGTFAVYWPRARADVGEVMRRFVESAARLAGLAVENARRETRLRTMIDELRRWQQVTLGREGRMLELKAEINALAARLGDPPRYGSAGKSGEEP